MKATIWLWGGWLLAAAAPSWALTTEEVIKLKQAGVSDATIEKMLEQERRGAQAPAAPTQTGPVTETNDQVIYRSGKGNPEDIRRMEQHERWKERQSMEMLKGGIIIDGRTGQPARPAPGGAATGGQQ